MHRNHRATGSRRRHDRKQLLTSTPKRLSLPSILMLLSVPVPADEDYPELLPTSPRLRNDKNH